MKNAKKLIQLRLIAKLSSKSIVLTTQILSIFLLLILVLNACDSSDSTMSPAVIPSPNAMSRSNKWEIENLSDSLEALKANQMTFMDEALMLGTYLELDIGENIDLDLSNRDKIYYIYSGNGSLMIDGVKSVAKAGTTFFIKANTTASFSDIQEHLQVVIVTMKTISSSSSPARQSFSKSTIEAKRSSTSNIWNPFIQFPNMILGLYMLPQSLGGDSRLVHTWEELNIITSGASKFKMDSNEINVEKGSIIFVRDGNGHFFKSLTSDIDILIFWSQP